MDEPRFVERYDWRHAQEDEYQRWAAVDKAHHNTTNAEAVAGFCAGFKAGMRYASEHKTEG